MIYALQGNVDGVKESFFVLRVGDVFYKILAGEQVLKKVLGMESVKVFCSPYIKDEKTPELYGFLDEQSLQFFELLIGVSGVGRKIAFKILDGGTVPEISSAIAGGKVDLFSRVPGIGKKTAERIILELREKIHLSGSEEITGRMEADRDVLDTLMQLGFPRENIQEALKEMGEEPIRFEDRLKKALQDIGRE